MRRVAIILRGGDAATWLKILMLPLIIFAHLDSPPLFNMVSRRNYSEPVIPWIWHVSVAPGSVPSLNPLSCISTFSMPWKRQPPLKAMPDERAALPDKLTLVGTGSDIVTPGALKCLKWIQMDLKHKFIGG